MTTISISCTLPATPHAIWPLLSKIDTLRYIASPYAMFTPIDAKADTVWREGAMLRFRMRVFGFLPLGVHTIEICTFDRDRCLIQSTEHNRAVPVWRHWIRLVPLGENSTRYTDEVEIGAGAWTGIIALWAGTFYRHRQKKWMKLLKQTSGFTKEDSP